MTITSMSGNELYRTLMGRDNPHANFTETVKNDLSAENPNNIKGLTENTIKSVQSDEMMSPQKRSDCFEHYANIDYFDTRHFVELGQGYDHNVPTKERIAEYFGKVGKELDEAYAQGKLSKDEFDELNDMLAKTVEKKTANAERNTAFYALGKERGSLSAGAARSVILREQSMSAEEFQADLKSRIDEYVEKFCKIDRESLWQLLNSFRYGK